MSLNTGFFPPNTYRRKQTTASYNLPLNNQNASASLNSERSSIEGSYGNESFLPSITTANNNGNGHKPYRRNDFANNHLFIAKSKLAGVFLRQSTKNLRSTSDLIHLFDGQDSKQKKRNLNKQKRQEIVINKTSSCEQDGHLSIVNLVMKPPYPRSQTRDPLAAILHYHHSQASHSSLKKPRPSIDTMNSTNKQNFQPTSLHTFEDDNEIDEQVDYDKISDSISTAINPFDSSLLTVKTIIPSAGPQHTHHHLLQYR